MRQAEREISGEKSTTEKPGHVGLFAGKLHPPTAAGLLARQRLHAMLDDGVDRGIVIISAPAGTGKTSLVADWGVKRQRTPRDLAWVTLDEADRVPGRFLRYVIASIGSTAAGHEALAGLSPLPPFTAPDETYLAEVADAMARVTDGVVLVLDDFQEVVGSETEELLQRILRYPPDRVRVVVVTRVEPNLGQARLRLDGRLLELGPQDLALTHDETGALLSMNGVPLGPADVRLLHEKTEGWVAAVRIAASSLVCTPDPAATLRTLPVEDRALSDYLLTEVYACQRGDLQEFMLRTCVVERLCGDLADALTGDADGDRLLSELQGDHIVLDVTEPDGQWYRWQPVLAAMLRNRLHASNPALERDLHRAAAGWFREEGHPVDAIEHALAGRDTEAAVTVLGECWLDLVVEGESAVLTHLLRLFEEETLASNAELAVAGAFMGVRADDIDASLALARKAVALSRRLDRPRRLRVETMATVVQLYAATMTGQACEGHADTVARKLLQRTSGSGTPLGRRDRIRRALLFYNLGAFETSRQQYDEGRTHLLAALAEAERLDMPYLQLSCRAQLIEPDVRDGDLSRGLAHGSEVLDAAETRGWRSYHGLTTAHVNLAAIAVLRDELDAALGHLSEAERIAKPVDHLNRFRVAFLRATTLCAAGQVAEAKDELERLHTQPDGKEPPAWVRVTVTMADAMNDGCQGHPDEGLRRLESVSLAGCGPSAADDYHVLRARLLLRCERPTEARAALATLVQQGSGRPVNVSASVLNALAAEQLGRHEEALDVLDEALAAAGRERLIRPLVAPGAQTRPLLEELLDRGTANEGLAVEVLEHMRTSTAAEPVTSGLSPFYVEPLSERELEVLRHLQGTHTNAEIADELYVSVNTLRSHMKSINRKLGAADRRDAVRRARELGIL